jgi:hypothetical protein
LFSKICLREKLNIEIQASKTGFRFGKAFAFLTELQLDFFASKIIVQEDISETSNVNVVCKTRQESVLRTFAENALYQDNLKLLHQFHC